MIENTSPQSKSLEFGDIATSVFSQYKANFDNLSIKYLIIYFIQFVSSIVISLAVGLAIFGTQINGFLILVVSAFTISFLIRSTNELARGNQIIPTGDLFKFDQRYYINYLVASLLVGFSVLLGTLLFILPGIYLALRMQFVFNLIVDGKHSAIEAISESFRLTSENRVWSVLLIDIITIGLYLGVSLAAGIVVGIIKSITGIKIDFFTNLVMSIIITPLLILLNSHIYVRLENQSSRLDLDSGNN